MLLRPIVVLSLLLAVPAGSLGQTGVLADEASVFASASPASPSPASYTAYLADVHALQDALAADGKAPCLYADPRCGQLAHAVLDPAQSLAMLETFYLHRRKWQAQQAPDNLPAGVAAISQRYKQAFLDDPKAYEAEYLDAVEWEAHNLIRTKSETELALLPLVAQNEDVKRAEMARVVVRMNLAAIDSAMQASASDIEASITADRLSPVGQVRATRIAQSLAPIPVPLGTVEEQAVNLDYGARLYEANCAACHQSDGHGIGGVFPDLTTVPTLSGKDATLFAILHGGRGMPGWSGALSPKQIAAIENYARLRLALQRDGVVTPTGVVEAMRKLDAAESGK